MKILRTAVAGLGRIGWQFHAPEVAGREGFELSAVVDPLPDRLAEAKARWGVPGYGDFGRMLAEVGPDLVVIASPTPFHAAQAAAAFDAGAHVFCDKPVAATLAEADRMIEAARRRGRRLMVYQPHRATAETQALRAVLASGLLGDLAMIKRGNSQFSRRNDWQARAANGGGMLNNYGAHFIDLLLHLAGSRARRIRCALRAVAILGDADDLVKATIETESGVILDLDINSAAAWPLQPWLVLGSRGAARLDEDAKTWRVRYFLSEEAARVGLQEGFAAQGRRYDNGETLPWREKAFPVADYPPVDFYARCHRYFADGGEPYVPVEETREVMRVLAACRADAERAADP